MMRGWRAVVLAFSYVMSVAANLILQLITHPAWWVLVAMDVVLGAVIGLATKFGKPSQVSRY